MNKWFVFYQDAPVVLNGEWDRGMVELDSEGAALQFIQDRLDDADNPDIHNYKIIRGRAIKFKAVLYATRLEVDDT